LNAVHQAGRLLRAAGPWGEPRRVGRVESFPYSTKGARAMPNFGEICRQCLEDLRVCICQPAARPEPRPLPDWLRADVREANDQRERWAYEDRTFDR
jgi:hypothetical protein